MTGRALALVVCLFPAVLYVNAELLAWDDKTTHPDLSAIASENSILGKDSANYLKDLGILGGLSERIRWGDIEQSVQAWIQEGARLEDEGSGYLIVTGSSRSYNHFHNALKSYPWYDAGLDDWFLIHVGGESSLAWAQDQENQASSVGGDDRNVGPDYEPLWRGPGIFPRRMA